MSNVQINSILTNVLQETAKQVLPDEKRFEDLFCSIMQAAGMSTAESTSTLCAATGFMEMCG